MASIIAAVMLIVFSMPRIMFLSRWKNGFLVDFAGPQLC